jgi:4-hydroxy-3-methylbut-2-enyl diphosphate reductase
VDVDRVLLAEPRGFCAGVEMAIKALAWMVRTFEPPVYCYHEIVHNRLVVERFQSLGVIFVDDIADVPEGRPIMLSAHGSAPEVVAAARARGSYVVDSVCPLVTKVHHEVKVRAGKGYRIVYVGHAGPRKQSARWRSHPTRSVASESVAGGGRALPSFDEPVALLAQTTLSHRDWEGVAGGGQAPLPGRGRPGAAISASRPPTASRR